MSDSAANVRMKYAHYDHIDWVERNIAAVHSVKPTRTEAKRAVERCGWFAAPAKLDDFQRRVITIVGIVGGGIYNAPITWDSVQWNFGNYPGMVLSFGGELASYDGNELTLLVVLCHEAGIRLAVKPASHATVKLIFTPCDLHPTDISAIVDLIRNELGPDHPVKAARLVEQAV